MANDSPLLPKEKKLFTIQDFEIDNIIGRGNFGVVKMAKCKHDGKIYAIKSI
jgi:hypothetical protein